MKNKVIGVLLVSALIPLGSVILDSVSDSKHRDSVNISSTEFNQSFSLLSKEFEKPFLDNDSLRLNVILSQELIKDSKGDVSLADLYNMPVGFFNKEPLLFALYDKGFKDLVLNAYESKVDINAIKNSKNENLIEYIVAKGDFSFLENFSEGTLNKNALPIIEKYMCKNDMKTLIGIKDYFSLYPLNNNDESKFFSLCKKYTNVNNNKENSIKEETLKFIFDNFNSKFTINEEVGLNLEHFYNGLSGYKMDLIKIAINYNGYKDKVIESNKLAEKRNMFQEAFNDVYNAIITDDFDRSKEDKAFYSDEN